MEKYQPTNYAEFLFKYFDTKQLNIIVPILFVFAVLSLLINVIISVILLAIFILIIFNRIFVNVIENKRILKYCKLNDITTDEFNSMNKTIV